jgi:ATP adenylyltransferase
VLLVITETEQFQLRYCPALAKKPEPQKQNVAPTKKPDPFDNPPSDLLIAHVPSANPSHVLVLNKFPVIESHFIVATKANKPQTHMLEQNDLEVTYACLKAWHGMAANKQRKLFAFFNSGDHSGASQPHRHLQFLPVEHMMQGQESNGWDLLVDLVLSNSEPVTEGNFQE